MFIHNPVTKYEIQSKTTSRGRFYTIDDSTKYPSITTVLGHKPKPWLEDWRQMLGPKKADKETKRCADRGEAVHLMAEYYLNNNEDYEDGQQREHIKLFNKLKPKLNKINNIRAQEIPLYSKRLQVAGRVDCIAEYDGVLSAIDFKTSNKIKTLDMIKDYWKQAAFYAIAYNEMYKEPIEQLVIIIAVEQSIMAISHTNPINEHIVPLLTDIKSYYNQ